MVLTVIAILVENTSNFLQTPVLRSILDTPYTEQVQLENKFSRTMQDNVVWAQQENKNSANNNKHKTIDNDNN
jgi:hypothetical protein